MSLFLEDEIADKILSIRRKPAMLLTLHVYKEAFVLERHLLEALKIKKSVLYSSMEYIEHMKLVKRYKAEDGSMYYTVHPDVIADRYGRCEDCEFGKQKLRRIGGKKVITTGCGFDKECIENIYRRAKFTVKISKRLLGLKPASVQVLKISDNQIEREYKSRNIQEWQSRDFHLFMSDLYKEHYPHMTKWTVRKIGTAFGEIRTIFKHEFEHNWKMYLRRYIQWNFKIAETYMPDMKIMASVSSIKKFMAEDKSYKNRLCKHYNIYCPYFKKNKCGLDGGKKKCTDRIRNKMESL